MRNELEKYLEQIEMEYQDLKTLSPIDQEEYLFAICARHVQTFPYQNFKLREISQQNLLQRQSLTRDSFWDLLGKNSGGYCYQLALLLKSALDALGYQVDCCAARVLNGLAVNSPELLKIPPTHVILVVTLNEKKFLLDAGLGPRSPRFPIVITEIPTITKHDLQQYQFYRLEQEKVYVLEKMQKFPRKLGDEWEKLIQTDLIPLKIEEQDNLLFKLGTFPHEIGIRDSKIVVGKVTPFGCKFLFWDNVSRQFEFTYDEQYPRKKIHMKFFLEGYQHACKVLKNEFDFNINETTLESYCGKALFK